MKTKTAFTLLKVCAGATALGVALQLNACAGQDMAMKDNTDKQTAAQPPLSQNKNMQLSQRQSQSQSEKGAQQTARVNITRTAPKEPTIGHEEKARLELDDLATSLAKYRDVYRIGESVIVPLPDSHLFRANNNALVSDKGATLLSKISKSLREHPDTRVYIQEYVPAGNTRIQSREKAMDQAYILRSELINRLVPANRLVVNISQRQTQQNTSGATPPETSATEHRFDLHIIPLIQ